MLQHINKNRKGEIFLKNYLFYLLFVSIVLTLGACSNEMAEEKPTAIEISQETEEAQEKIQEEPVFDWNALSSEEKEKMISDALKEAGYEDFPIEPFVTSLDDAYSSGLSMDEDFLTIFGYTLNNFQEPYIIRWGDQYGDDFYAENDNQSIYHVAETNNTVFTVHGLGFSRMFYSYAKDGVWVKRDIPLFANNKETLLTEKELVSLTIEKVSSMLQKEGLNPDNYDFSNVKMLFDNTSLYLLLSDKRNIESDRNNVMLHFSLGEEGAVENGMTQNVPRNPTILKTSKNKLGMILYDNTNENYHLVYLEDKEKKPIKTFQPSEEFKKSLASNTNTVDRVYYYEDTGLMVIGDSHVYHLDTNTGEPVWNASGQEDEYEFAIRDSVVNFYGGDKLAIAYSKNNTFNIYDEFMNPQGVGVDIPFNLKTGSAFPEFWVTSNDSSYTVWKQHTFKGKPALQYVTIQKGIEAYKNTAN